MDAATAATIAPPLLRDMLKLVPDYDGNTKTLTLFLKKCEYVIQYFQGTTQRNEFLMQCLTSKLVGKAAALISERGDFTSYDDLRALLIQHFGDPRSEESVAFELESLKLKSGESYLDFCGRVQDMRAILFSKIHQNSANSEDVKQAKKIIHNNTALNVFLYNLPEHMVRVVRLKQPLTLEDALKHVLEEVNFQDQYQLRSKMLQHLTVPKPPPLPVMQQQQYKFGIPNQAPIAFRPQPIRPPFNMNNNYRPPMQFGYKPNFATQTNIPRPQMAPFGYRPPQPFNQGGYRPQAGQFGYRPPQPQGFRPQPGQFGFQQPQHQGYKPPVPFTSDVTMRTVQPRQVPLNEMTITQEQADDFNPNYEEQGYGYYEDPNLYYDPVVEYTEEQINEEETKDDTVENFCLTLSSKPPR